MKKVILGYCLILLFISLDFVTAEGSPRRVRLGAEQQGFFGVEIKGHSTYETCIRDLKWAGEAGCDIVNLVECCGFGSSDIPGIYTNACKSICRKYGMYIISWQSFKGVHDNVNTIQDRNGKLVKGDPGGDYVGVFQKVHFHNHTESEYWPVFPTDFGKIGTFICMDGYYPETYRCLALNGAEIGFISTVSWAWAETKDLVTCANALLNGMYVVVATMGYSDSADECPDGEPEGPNNPESDFYQLSKIIDTGGNVIADSNGIPGVVYADVDVSVKYRTPGRVGTYEPGELRQIIMSRRRPDTYGILTEPKNYPMHVEAPDHSVKAAAIQWGKTPATRSLTTLNERINVMRGYLDNAGLAGCDVIVMPEGWCGWDAYQLRVGKSIYDLCRRKARQYGMYVVGWQVEDAGGKKYNTAFLMDRSGRLMGSYRKVHLDWKDELEGITAGSTYPKFDASSDFETLGLLTGFDNLFFEAPRCLCRDKVHVLLTPISNIDALGKEKFELVMRRTALQEGMWVVASLNSEIGTDACAGIFSTWGRVVAKAATDGIVTYTFNTNEVLWWSSENRYYREVYMGSSRPEAYGHLCDPVVVPLPGN